jgi:HEAT repeat protein
MINLGKWTGQLTAGDAVSRRRAVGALGDLGADAVPAAPALAQALVDENPFVRQEAAEALGGIGPGAAAAVPALIEALDDPDPGVRKSAAAALAAIRGP